MGAVRGRRPAADSSPIDQTSWWRIARPLTRRRSTRRRGGGSPGRRLVADRPQRWYVSRPRSARIQRIAAERDWLLRLPPRTCPTRLPITPSLSGKSPPMATGSLGRSCGGPSAGGHDRPTARSPRSSSGPTDEAATTRPRTGQCFRTNPWIAAWFRTARIAARKARVDRLRPALPDHRNQPRHDTDAGLTHPGRLQMVGALGRLRGMCGARMDPGVDGTCASGPRRRSRGAHPRPCAGRA